MHERAVVPLIFGREDNFILPAFVGETIGPLLGFLPEELRIEGWWKRQFHLDDLMVLRSALRAAWSSGGSTRSTCRVLAKDGSERWIEHRTIAMRNGSRPVKQVLCVWQDVTKEVERETIALAAHEFCK